MNVKIICRTCNSELAHACSAKLKDALLSAYALQEPDPPSGRRRDLLPFFSESYLYDHFGKDYARAILARLNNIARAAGLDPYTLQEQAVEYGKKESY